MALTALELDTIKRGIQAAQSVTRELYPLLKELNIIYDSQDGAKTTITQQNLDAEGTLSGITKAQLDDAMFVLTATLRGDIENGYAQLAELSARQ